MIACVQMRLEADDYRTEQSFEAKIMGIMEQIRKESGPGRLLVVFPEHVGTFCLLCNAPEAVWSKPSFAKASTALVFQHGLAVAHQMLVHRVSPVRALLLARSKEVERIYLSTFSKAAQKYEAWIVAGSATLRWGETKRVFNTSPVIAPSGRIVYRQHKVHLVDMEGKEGLQLDAAPLNYMSAVQTPMGSLGVAICLDAFKQEVRDRLRGLGSQVFIQPSANNGPWSDWQQKDWLHSSFAAVAEKKEFLLAVNPMLVGHLWDLVFEGQSSIIDQNGYVLQAQTFDQEEILIQKDHLN